MLSLEKLRGGKFTPLGPEDRFCFDCQDECMGRCCRKTNIILEPWDLEVMARGLGLNTSDFVDTYAELQIDPETLWPYVHLRHVADGPCAFLAERGHCRIYPLRPRVCRSYPVGRRVVIDGTNAAGEPALRASFFLLQTPQFCLGPRGTRTWTLSEWLETSGSLEYFRLSAEHLALKALALELKYHQWWEGPPHMLHMLFLFEPDLIREEFEISENDVGHVEFYRRRMQALRLLLTDQAARQGYHLETTGGGGEVCALDLTGTAPDILDWMLSVLRGEKPGG